MLITVFAYSQIISDNKLAASEINSNSYKLNSHSEKPTMSKLSDNLNFATIQNDSLFTNNEQYDKYKSQYYKSRKNASTGSIVMIFGGVTVVSGLLLGSLTNKQAFSNKLLISGFILFNIGAPITISNSAKAENNRKAMGKIENSIKASLTATNSGIGITVNF